MSYFRVFSSMITLPGAAFWIALATSSLIVVVAGSSQSAMKRHLAAEDLAQPGADLRQRLFRLAADVPEDDLIFQPLLPAVVERAFHRAQADVAFAHLGARLGVHVAADQHRRAAGQIGQRVQAGNGLQVFLHRQLGHVGVVAQDAAGKGHDLFSSDSHGKSPYSSVDNVKKARQRSNTFSPTMIAESGNCGEWVRRIANPRWPTE